MLTTNSAAAVASAGIPGAQLVQRLGLGGELGPDAAALAPDGRAVAQQDPAAGGEDLGQLGRRDQRQLGRLGLLEPAGGPDVGAPGFRVDAGDHGLLALAQQLDHVPLAVDLDHGRARAR